LLGGGLFRGHDVDQGLIRPGNLILSMRSTEIHIDLALLLAGCEVRVGFILAHRLLEGSDVALHNLKCYYIQMRGIIGIIISRGKGAVVEVLEDESEGLLKIDGCVKAGRGYIVLLARALAE
jgi:hypothetical protein